MRIPRRGASGAGGAAREDARDRFSVRGDPNAGDGRGVDTDIAVLEGEGAEQAVPADRWRAEGAPPFEVWTPSPSPSENATAAAGSPTYYDLPVLKEPVWMWAVPAYFYAGGAAGAAAVLGAAAQVADRDGLADLVAWSRRIAAGGTALGTGLLIYDLGRPGRFLNMLRVFRATSPLSVGSWVLASITPLAAASAALGRSRGPGRTIADAAGLGAGALGVPLAGYTAVLLANTAVPIWSAIRRSLPPLFVASAASSAAALLSLAPMSGRSRAVAVRFGRTALAAELLAVRAVERDASSAERVSRPLHRGPAAALWRASEASAVAALALSLVPSRRTALRRAGAVLATAGGIALRFAIYHAGKASARDPRATFEPQRSGAAT